MNSAVLFISGNTNVLYFVLYFLMHSFPLDIKLNFRKLPWFLYKVKVNNIKIGCPSKHLGMYLMGTS